MRITIQANSGELSFECDAAERLLYAGLAQGLRLPYECGTGTCGTCRGRVVEGSTIVEWDEAPGFARLKRAKGDVLMCQARPATDCVIRVPANIAADPGRPLFPAHRTGRIERVRRLNGEVIDFEVVLSDPMTFEAGQFVVVEVASLQGGRAYSMVNFDPDARSLRLVVRQKPGGGFSNWLFAGGVDGSQVKVFGPLGHATFRPEEGHNLLCVAGGSGLAGMMSILERARREHYFRAHTGQVFFGVRTLADGFYLEELSEHVAAAHGSLEVTLALSHAPAETATHPQHPNIKLAAGMVTDAMVQATGGRYDDPVAFIAGPTPMVDIALRLLIREARLPPAFVRYDKFT
jgi:toluene monooxygenase electron transfer component